MQVSLLICIILDPIINCTLEVPHYMLCNQVSMSQIHQELAEVVHKKACVWYCIC